jgi:hypothetical protein
MNPRPQRAPHIFMPSLKIAVNSPMLATSADTD